MPAHHAQPPRLRRPHTRLRAADSPAVRTLHQRLIGLSAHRAPPPETPTDGAAPPADPHDSLGSWLIDHLVDGGVHGPLATLPEPERLSHLAQAAIALAEDGEVWRLGGQAGDLAQRWAWYQRWLALWPAAERERWLVAQRERGPQRPDQAAQQERLAGHLFDPALTGRRLSLQALWMALRAPGPVALDAAQRLREQAEASALVEACLAEHPAAGPGPGQA